MHLYRRRPLMVVQAILDIASLWLIWRLTIALRIELNPFTARQVAWSTAALWAPSRFLVLLLWAIVSIRLKLYCVPDRIRTASILGWAAANALALCVLAVLATFFSQQFGAGTSRLFVVCLAPVSFVTLLAARGVGLLFVTAFQRGKVPPRVALVGDLRHAGRLVASLDPTVASTIRGVIVPEGSTVPEIGSTQPVLLGTTGQLAELVNREHIDHVILLKRSLPDAEVEHCKKILWRMRLPVSYALDLPRELREAKAGLRLDRMELSQQYGLPTVDVRHRSERHHHDTIKRLFDVTVAAASLILVSPLLMLIALFVKLRFHGPVLQRTLHLGRGGRHFHSLRFHMADGSAAQLSGVPALLRRFRLDELPQLANVLRGRMSLVGPAPLPVSVADHARADQELAKWQQVRSLVHPGLTGLWQVQPASGTMEQLMELDLQYVAERSIWLDMSVLLRTPAGIRRGIRLPDQSRMEVYSFALSR